MYVLNALRPVLPPQVAIAAAAGLGAVWLWRRLNRQEEVAEPASYDGVKVTVGEAEELDYVDVDGVRVTHV